MKRALLTALLLGALLAHVAASPSSASARVSGKRPPNLLVILADDLGFSDLGCYGGELRTPNLDRLASKGLRFTQFYNTARCWPSRAALLTGYYAQQVRRDTVPGLPSGSSGVRPKWARLLPSYLKPLGYRSYHSGKWHVDGLPVANGFDRSYLVQDQDRFFSPRVHFEDDRRLPPVPPESGYYATVAIAGHAVRTLREHAEKERTDGKRTPFFHYLAFTAPHFPLQALPEDIARYRGRYHEGWDVLRRKRWKRMRERGLAYCELSPRTPGVPAWDSLAPEEKARWEARMEVHAAMVDRMDREIGRVLDQLRSMKALDETVVCFLSDNGASAESLVRGDGNDPVSPAGSAKTFLCLEPGWANVANAPLRYSKIFVHEGGISTPFIIHWPEGIRARGELRRNPGHVVDLAPTLLALAGGRWPESWDGRPMPPAPGRDLAPLFTRDGTVEHPCLWWFHSGHRAVRVGDWKLVSEAKGENGAAGKPGPWELYDLSADRSETRDRAAEYPERVRALEREWSRRMEEFGRLARQDLPAEAVP